MKSFALRLPLLLISFISVIFAQSPENQIAVLDLDPIGVTEQESKTLTDRLRSDLVNSG